MTRERAITAWLILLLAGAATNAAAESDSPPSSSSKRSVVAALNVTQLQYKDWAAGGENALSYVAQVNADLELKKTRASWQFVGKFAFGQTKFGNGQLRNSTDQIDMDGTFSYRLSDAVNPFLGAGLRTQFATGYDYRKKPPQPRSAFRDPLYLNQTLGANLATGSGFRSRIGVGFQETLTRRYTTYSDNPKTAKVERQKVEAGIQSTSTCRLKLGRALMYDGRLRLFSTFDHIDEVDVQWDNVVTAQVAKYVAVNLTVNVLYDKDVSLRTQLKQQLAIGLTYNLF
jgi:hypothetical protein